MATNLESQRTASAVSGEEIGAAGTSSNEQSNLEHLTIPEVLKQLGVDPKAGLSSAETQKRLIS